MTERLDLEELYKQDKYIEAIDFIKEYNESFKNLNENYPKFLIKTYGCQMNEHDSERMKWILDNLNFIFTEDETEAQYIMYNTCLIRENAELKVYGKVGSLKSYKKDNPGLKIILCGCMMQNEDIRNTIQTKYKHVDIIFGTNSIHDLPLFIYDSLTKNTLVEDSIENNDLIVENIDSIRKFSYKAFVNIMYGCNNFCTYCVVPYTRGREMSRLPSDILAEINDLAKNNVKEVILLGQNVNSYGKKFENGYRFYNLLSDIDKIEGISRLNFMTSHPKDISDELIDCFGNLKKLTKYIHLPVQSGSDRILKEMNRHYTSEEYLNIIDKLRVKLNDIAVSTDIIVGFPGETEEDFQATLDLVKKVRFDSCFSFIYSPRPGTKAAKFENQIDETEKSNRLHRLNELLNNISYEKNLEYVGREEVILVEDISKSNVNTLSGRTNTNKLVHFLGDENLIGKFVKVKIKTAKSFTLEGELLEVLY